MHDDPYEIFQGNSSVLPRITQRRLDNYIQLRDAALKRFNNRLTFENWGPGVLSEAEHETLFSTATGFYLPVQDKDNEAYPTPTDRVEPGAYKKPGCPVHDKDPARWVSADFLRWLCTDSSLIGFRDLLGVFCCRSVIVGEFRIDFLNQPELRVAALNSIFLGTVSVRSARLQRLCFRGSHLYPSGSTNRYWRQQRQVTGRDTRVYRNRAADQDIVRLHPDFNIVLRDKSLDEHLQIDVRSLVATGIRMRGDADLSRGFRAEGPVELDNCRIDGTIDFTDAILRRDELGEDYIPALTIGNGEVGRSVILRRAEVTGVVHMSQAKIAGNVSLAGAAITYRDQPNHAMGQARNLQEGAKRISCYRSALNMRYTHVGGTIDLSAAPSEGICYEYNKGIRHAQIIGGVMLRRARIGGDLKLHSVTLDAHFSRSALDATGIMIRGNVMAQRSVNNRYGRQPFIAYGNVRFRGAKIGGQADFTGATLRKRFVDLNAEQNNVTGYAPTHTWSLDFCGAHIGSKLKMDDDFVAERGICLRSATIDDKVTITASKSLKKMHHATMGCRITAPDQKMHTDALGRAIDAFRVKINGSFYLDGPDAIVNGKIDFTLARIRGRFGVGRRAGYDAARTLKHADIFGPSLFEFLLNQGVSSTKKEGHWLTVRTQDDDVPTEQATSLPKLGAINLRHAKIGFELCIGPSSMREASNKQELLAANPVLIVGRIDAVHIQVNNQAYLGRTTFQGYAHESPSPAGDESNHTGSERTADAGQFKAAVDFTSGNIDGSMFIDGSIILGGICLDSIQVSQDLIFRRGLAYSKDATPELWGKLLRNQLVKMLPHVYGSGLRAKRHEPDAWAVSVRHAKIERTLSLRSAFAVFGSCMFVRSKIEGYFELCELSGDTRKLIEEYEIQEKLEKETKCKYVWPTLWSLNLSGTHAGVVWWSLARSGVYTKEPSSEYSLADMLFINDFTYTNIWFFTAIDPNTHPLALDEADKTLVMQSEQSDFERKSCNNFLHLQSLPGSSKKRRKRRMHPELLSKVGTYENFLAKKKIGSKFHPQPYEHMAAIAKAHGRSDLFTNCHVEKWQCYTRSIRNRTNLKRICSLPAFIMLTILSFFLLPVIASETWASPWFSQSNLESYSKLALIISFSVMLFASGYGFILWKYQTYLSKWFERRAPHTIHNRRSIPSRLRRFLIRTPQPNLSCLQWYALALFSVGAGYGYRPSKLIGLTFLLIVLGSVLSSYAHQQGILRPSSALADRVIFTERIEANNTGLARGDSAKPHAREIHHEIRPFHDNMYSPDYPAFNSVVYAADLLIPVIGLEQAEHWHSFPFEAKSHKYVELVAFVTDKQGDSKDRAPQFRSDHSAGNYLLRRFNRLIAAPVEWCARGYLVFYYCYDNYKTAEKPARFISVFALVMFVMEPLFTLMGWVLVTMGIASATRLIRHE